MNSTDIICAAFASLGALGSTVAGEKDWVTGLHGHDAMELAILNAGDYPLCANAGQRHEYLASYACPTTVQAPTPMILMPIQASMGCRLYP